MPAFSNHDYGVSGIMPAPRITGLLRAIDGFTALIGKSVAWLTLAMVLITCMVRKKPPKTRISPRRSA